MGNVGEGRYRFFCIFYNYLYNDNCCIHIYNYLVELLNYYQFIMKIRGPQKIKRPRKGAHESVTWKEAQNCKQQKGPIRWWSLVISYNSFGHTWEITRNFYPLSENYMRTINFQIHFANPWNSKNLVPTYQKGGAAKMKTECSVTTGKKEGIC